MTDDILYTVDAAAARLGKSTKTIRRMIQRQQLEAVQVKGIHGQEWRVRLPAVDSEPGPETAIMATPSTLPSPDLDRLISSIDALTAELRLAREERARVDESRTRLPWWKRVFTRFSNWP